MWRAAGWHERIALAAVRAKKGNDRFGLGLGLLISAQAMRTLDGELRIRDIPGKRRVFSLDLPLHGASAGA